MSLFSIIHRELIELTKLSLPPPRWARAGQSLDKHASTSGLSDNASGNSENSLNNYNQIKVVEREETSAEHPLEAEA